MADKMVIRVTHLPTGRVYTSLPEDYSEEDWNDAVNLLQRVEDLSYLSFLSHGGESKIVIPAKILQESILEMAME